MEVIKIHEMGYIPGIHFNHQTGVLEMTGKACPEDAVDFYRPILKWIDEYAQKPSTNTVFNFKLSYYNTASSKILLNILQKLDEIKKNNFNVSINWYYFEDDEELLNAGEDFSEMIAVPFKFIATE